MVGCEDKKPFFESSFKVAVDKEKGHIIAYDVTFVPTYLKTNIDAKEGYNRDKGKLPQVNIGLMTNISTCIPIYIDSYAGSLTDAENLIDFTKKAKQYYA